MIIVAIPPTGPVDYLMSFASAMVDSVGGHVLLATVVSLPRITPYAAADALIDARNERLARIRGRGPEGLRLTRVVVVGHRVADALAALARQRGADLMIIGWPEDGQHGGLTKASTTALDIVKRAPCSVCVVEHAPTSPSDLVLVSAASGRETELGLSVAAAMVSCASLTSARVDDSGRARTREAKGSDPWSTVEPDPAFDARIDRIAVSDPMPSADDRRIAERATALGADVLVASALRSRGVWPLRRTVLRSNLANFFSGPVALVHARGPFLKPHAARGSNHDA